MTHLTFSQRMMATRVFAQGGIISILATVMIVSLPRFALTEVCAHTLHTKDTLLQMYTHTNTYLNLTFISSSSFPAIRRRTMSINAVDTRNIERHSYNDVNGLQPLISADLYYFKRVFLIHPHKDRTLTSTGF